MTTKQKIVEAKAKLEAAKKRLAELGAARGIEKDTEKQKTLDANMQTTRDGIDKLTKETVRLQNQLRKEEVDAVIEKLQLAVSTQENGLRSLEILSGRLSEASKYLKTVLTDAKAVLGTLQQARQSDDDIFAWLKAQGIIQ